MRIDDELIERLLYEEESETIDFKGDQYKFVNATDDEKSDYFKISSRFRMHGVGLTHSSLSG